MLMQMGLPSRAGRRLRPRFVLLALALAFVVSLFPYAPTALAATPAAGRAALTPPAIAAKAAIAVEYPSGRVIYQQNAHARLAMASTTKIMTAILTIEYAKLDEVATVSRSDLARGTSMGLRAGERITLRNLLYGLMLNSGNDAAMTLARHIGSKVGKAPKAKSDPVGAFVDLMNARALQLGLKDTHFANPHGLDARGHYTSAYDLASLTWFANHFELFNSVVQQDEAQVAGHPLHNLNKMLAKYSGADGVKTGYTGKAGLCLVTSATRAGKRVITVVLNAPGMYDQSTSLLDHAFAVSTLAPARLTAAETLQVARPAAASR